VDRRQLKQCVMSGSLGLLALLLLLEPNSPTNEAVELLKLEPMPVEQGWYLMPKNPRNWQSAHRAFRLPQRIDLGCETIVDQLSSALLPAGWKASEPDPKFPKEFTDWKKRGTVLSISHDPDRFNQHWILFERQQTWFEKLQVRLSP